MYYTTNMSQYQEKKSCRAALYIFCFFMPKIILSKPPTIPCPLISTTFIKCLQSYFEQENPKIITQIAKTATKNRGGQKQLIRRPTAKVTPTTPLLKLHLLIISPPDIT